MPHPFTSHTAISWSSGMTAQSFPVRLQSSVCTRDEGGLIGRTRSSICFDGESPSLAPDDILTPLDPRRETMRKNIIAPGGQDAITPADEWLDLDLLARVEVTSE